MFYQKDIDFIRKILALVILLSLAALMPVLSSRMAAEKQNDTVEMVVHSTEVKSLALASDLSLEETVSLFREHGISSVLVKETSIGDLITLGYAEYFRAGALLGTDAYSSLPAGFTVEDNMLFILFEEGILTEETWENIRHKFPPSEKLSDNLVVLETRIPVTSEDEVKIRERIDAVGVGYDDGELAVYASAGLALVPQIRDWDYADEESLHFVYDRLDSLENISFILYNDKAVPGDPKYRQVTVEILNEKGLETGVIEFSPQQGLNQTMLESGKNSVRLHSISSAEMLGYSRTAALERMTLAASERNIRVLLVRFTGMLKPGAETLEYNLDYIDDLVGRLKAEGLETGLHSGISDVYYSRLLMLAGFAGIFAAVALFLINFLTDFLDGGKRYVISKKIPAGTVTAVLIAAAAGYLVLSSYFFINPLTARKMAALLAALVFPCLAFSCGFTFRGGNIPEAAGRLFRISGITFAGALFVAGLLADKSFMLSLNVFSGVKLAHILPLAVVPACLFLIREKRPAAVAEIMKKPVTWLAATAAVLAACLLAVYILRTGNQSGDLVPGIERVMREVLDNLLGVRPRTKEFLIGYPVLVLLLFYGLGRASVMFVLPAVIGQVSLLNTYAHIHTPLSVSFLRSFNGLWLGLLLGVAAVTVIEIPGRKIMGMFKNGKTNGDE